MQCHTCPGFAYILQFDDFGWHTLFCDHVSVAALTFTQLHTILRNTDSNYSTAPPGLERRVRLIDDLKRLAVAEDCKSMVAAVSGVALQLVDHVLTHKSFRFVAYGCLFDFRNTVSSTSRLYFDYSEC
jgi:hypothetical protein